VKAAIYSEEAKWRKKFAAQLTSTKGFPARLLALCIRNVCQQGFRLGDDGCVELQTAISAPRSAIRTTGEVGVLRNWSRSRLL
jgi:hypothetical protein